LEKLFRLIALAELLSALKPEAVGQAVADGEHRDFADGAWIDAGSMEEEDAAIAGEGGPETVVALLLRRCEVRAGGGWVAEAEPCGDLLGGRGFARQRADAAAARIS
jgi:hypothetical protein